MEKNRRYIVLSLILAISILIVSIPFWNFGSKSKIGLLANNYVDLPIVTKIGTLDSLVIINDASVFDVIKPTEIVFKNRNGFKKDFNLYLLVEKRSTIPYTYLRASVDDTVYNLNEIEYEEDNSNYYFYLKSYQIDAYQEDESDVRLWLSQDTKDVESTSTLVTNFIVR